MVIARSHLATRAALLVMLLTLAGCSGTSPAGSRGLAATSLVGAWRSKLQFSSGPFAAMKDLEFMYVFNTGGTMTESSNYDGAPPVPPAYGVWREVAPRQFEAKYLFYITKAPARWEEITSGGGWPPAGHGRFTERIQLAENGQSFESTITYEAFDSAGAPAAGSGEARGRAMRIGF